MKKFLITYDESKTLVIEHNTKGSAERLVKQVMPNINIKSIITLKNGRNSN